MCISFSLHYFIGCSLIGFKFEFRCHVQTQKHLVVFTSFLSFGPSPAGPSPLSSFSVCSPAHPAALSLLPSFFLPCEARSPPAHGLSLSFPLSFLPRAHTAHRPLPRPIGAPACAPFSPSSPYRADRRGPRVRPFSPTAPDSSSSPARPRAAFAVFTSGPHAQERSRPYLSTASPPRPKP
jgi:hypothetical protein